MGIGASGLCWTGGRGWDGRDGRRRGGGRESHPSSDPPETIGFGATAITLHPTARPAQHSTAQSSTSGLVNGRGELYAVSSVFDECRIAGIGRRQYTQRRYKARPFDQSIESSSSIADSHRRYATRPLPKVLRVLPSGVPGSAVNRLSGPGLGCSQLCLSENALWEPAGLFIDWSMVAGGRLASGACTASLQHAQSFVVVLHRFILLPRAATHSSCATWDPDPPTISISRATCIHPPCNRGGVWHLIAFPILQTISRPRHASLDLVLQGALPCE